MIPISQQALQSGHCCLEEFSQSSKISVLFKSAIKSCDSLLNLLIFCVWLKSWRKDSPYACGSRTSRSTSWPCSHVLYSAARLQKEVIQVFCDPRCCFRFPCHLSNRSMVPKMILRLGFVDLVDHIASSILARHVSLSELSEPAGRDHPEFSYIWPSKWKLQAMCCENDCMWPCLVKLQAFILGELQIAPKYYILKAFPSILVWCDPWFRKIVKSFSHAIYVLHRVHCCEEYCLSSSLDAFSSGINPFLIMEFNSPAFPTWKMYSVNPFGNRTLSCNAGSITLSPECPGIAQRYRNWIHAIYKIFSSLLVLLPELISNLQVTIAKHRWTSSSWTLRWCHCVGLLCQFLEGLFDNVVAIGWLLLTL